jgi:hypothetical protein
MESDWVKFFELVERLQLLSPGLVQLALRYGQSKDQEVLEEVERELGSRLTGQRPQEPFFEHSQKVNLRRCLDFLEELRRQEDDLRKRQVETTQNLLGVQAARKAFQETLKARLRAECRHSAPDQWAEWSATEEEVVAGLQELKEHGGLELHEFIGELEQVLHDRERSGK